MRRKYSFSLAIVLSFGLTFTSLWAQSPQLLNYQGKLSTGGNPATGTFNMTFSIYASTSGGTPLWTESQTVTVTNGVFNVLLGNVTPFPSTLFTGTGDRYLGVKVGNDPEMTPRFRLASVPFAIRANEADGVADNTVNSAKIIDGAVASADIADGAVGSADIADGAVAGTDLADNAVSSAKIQDGTITNADVSANAAITGAKINPDFGSQNILTTGKVSIGMRLPNTVLDGALEVDIPENGHVRLGTFRTASEVRFTNGLLRSDRSRFQIIGLDVFETESYPITFGQTRNDSDLTIATNGNIGIGTLSPTAKLHISGTAGVDGIRFPDGTTQTTAFTGGSGGLTLPFSRTNSSNSTLFSLTNTGTGEVGRFEIKNPISNSVALVARTDGQSGALYAVTTGNGSAVDFEIDNPSNDFAALFARTHGIGRAGYFVIENSTNSLSALYATTNGTGSALLLDHTGPSGNIVIFQNGSTNKARIDKTGKGFFNGGTQTGGADVAEAFETEHEITSYSAGDVLVISANHNRRVEKCREPYSTLVIGVYATKPGVLLTERDIEANLDDTIPVGVVGVIPTKVSGENGPIRRGDLLVTSSTPGHAMKGTDRDKMLGAIIGKALENFDGSDTSIIQVMVNVK